MFLAGYNIQIIIFDWGNTLMVDFPFYNGPMAYWPKVELMPGVEKVLEYLYIRIPLCVATNAGYSNTLLMRKALNRCNIEKYFTFFFSSDDAGGIKKPDPQFFFSLSKYIGIKPSFCLMIGNDYEKDIIGAKRIGIKTFFYNYELKQGNFVAADKVFHNYNELLDFFKQ